MRSITNKGGARQVENKVWIRGGAPLRDVDRPAPPFSGQTRDSQPVYAINGRCLELLVRAANSRTVGPPSLVTQLRRDLQGTSPEARSRAATRPVLLVDMQFCSLPWWELALSPSGRLRNARPGGASFSGRAGAQLARATLMLAWHTTRSQRESALLLGITPKVADVIASLSPIQIDELVERQLGWLRPRWEDRPAIWRALLSSARTVNPRSAREFAVYTVQLLTADLLAPTALPR
jgi:hypothetical protein